MDKSFINQVRNFISPETISDLSNATAASTGQLEKGLDLSITSVLLGFANQSKGSLAAILGQAKNYFVDSLDGSQASPVIKGGFPSLFGSSNAEVMASIQRESGLSEPVANTVMEQATSGVLGFFKNLSPNFDTDAIFSFLGANKGAFVAALPAGFSLLGFGAGKHSAPEPVVHAQRAQPVAPVKKEKGGSIWLYIILLLIAAALVYFFLNGKGKTPTTGTVNPTVVDSNSVQQVDGTSSQTVDLNHREVLKVTLPDGVVIDAYKGGIEDRLVAFLKTDYKKMGANQLKDTWFDFDNLNFETNSAVITEDSRGQLTNIVAILHAFPDTKLKIGGYTDKTGTEAVNIKLSGERAQAVKKSLETAGKGSQVDGAEGYGSKFAKYDATAPESERVLDRHISVSVR
ncbi:OmpA family protein [Flavobacterium sp. JP2137]|uniref:OmpA family protein n=1 Tax=Flavobacterium sp. JP2137 TaxID=3414510 RepID=UPI003D2FB962